MWSQMEVGIRALKEHLSDYLDRAARGELIVVTDRGEPKALLGPAPGRLSLDLGVAEGWIRPGNHQAAQAVRRSPSRVATLDVLKDDRAD